MNAFSNSSLVLALYGFQILWLVGLSLVAFLRRPGLEAGQAVSKHREEVVLATGRLEQRLHAVEQQLQHMPTAAEVAALQVAVGRLTERTDALSERIQSIAAPLGRIEGYLLEQANHRNAKGGH